MLFVIRFTLALMLAAPLLIPMSSHAAGEGFRLGISAMKNDYSTEGATLGVSDSTSLTTDIKAGMLMTSGLFIGAMFDGRTDDNNGSKTERSGYGVTAGYHNAGWFIDGTFLINEQIKLSSGTKVENGTGLGIDVGYDTDVNSHVFVGLQVSYKTISFTKVDGAEISNKLKSELMPMLTVGVMF